MKPSAAAAHSLQYDFDLTRHNTLRLPARAQAYARFHSVSELLSLLAMADREGWPVRILGGGSNILLNGEVPGLVLSSAMTGIRLLGGDEQYQRVAVDAGCHWHGWVCRSTEFGHGLENLALIPGSVGASPVQNIGAYGTEAGDYLESLTGIQLSTRQWRTLAASECRFAYRDSVFKRELAGDFIVTRVVFRLRRQFMPDLSYGPLKAWSESTEQVTPQALIAEVCRIRSDKLPDPEVTPNAGSFFKNPIVTASVAQQLQALHPSLPVYPQASGKVKLAAGWLIEQAGWKGRWLGHVGVHDRQALVLVTDGQADYAALRQLQQAIQRSVMAQFGVALEPEPQVL